MYIFQNAKDLLLIVSRCDLSAAHASGRMCPDTIDKKRGHWAGPPLLHNIVATAAAKSGYLWLQLQRGLPACPPPFDRGLTDRFRALSLSQSHFKTEPKMRLNCPSTRGGTKILKKCNIIEKWRSGLLLLNFRF